MQLQVPPTARGFLIPWELNAYSLAVLQQQLAAYLQGKKSTFCGIHCVPRPPCTEVYVYATSWKDDWKKEMQDICYKATATGCMPGMGLGGFGGVPGYDAPMIGAASGGMGMLPGMGGGMGMGMGGMGCMHGMGHGGMGGMGMGMGGVPGLGPACPPMMHGTPISWGHRPLPVLADRAPAAKVGGGGETGRRAIPKI